MKAMVLAAGLGTRLRPLTDDFPKALVTVAGRTLLEITLTRLRSVGVKDVIVNVHHFAEKVIDYLAANNNFGMRIEISPEPVLLDTGGGLKNAAWFFLQDASTEPFILHNVDVLSNIGLARMVRFHQENSALATLAVQARETARPLLFDTNGQLCGRRVGRDGNAEMVLDVAAPQAMAFAGIHVISTALLKKITEQGIFSIIPAYLRLAAAGEKVLAFPANDAYWRDLGKPESISQATKDIESGAVPGL